MYDVVVVGGGPGGYAGAIRASQLGGKVALVEAAISVAPVSIGVHSYQSLAAQRRPASRDPFG